MGFYKDDDPERYISRVPSVNWDDLQPDMDTGALLDRGVGLTAKDKNWMSECVLGGIWVQLESSRSHHNLKRNGGSFRLTRINRVINEATYIIAKTKMNRKEEDCSDYAIMDLGTGLTTLIPRDHAPRDADENIGGDYSASIVNDLEDEEQHNGVSKPKSQYIVNNSYLEATYTKLLLSRSLSVARLLKYADCYGVV